MYKPVKYYISEHQPNGLFLHRIDCTQLPPIESRVFIGTCYTLNQALSVSAVHFKQVNPFPFCIKDTDERDVRLKKKDVLLPAPTKPKKLKEERNIQPVKHMSFLK